MVKNEFEELDAGEEAPVQEFSNVPGEQDSLIASGTAGTVYNWENAPTGTKAPPRKDLNGKTLVLNKAEIILPPLDTPWLKTKDGTKDFKFCSFALHYDFEGQREYISGMRVFKRDGKYSHPTISKDRGTQASQLLGLYADFKKVDIAECSLKEFMAFLNSKPKVLIQTKEIINPQTNETIHKNLVGKFLNP